MSAEWRSTQRKYISRKRHDRRLHAFITHIHFSFTAIMRRAFAGILIRPARRDVGGLFTMSARADRRPAPLTARRYKPRRRRAYTWGAHMRTVEDSPRSHRWRPSLRELMLVTYIRIDFRHMTSPHFTAASASFARQNAGHGCHWRAFWASSR